MQNYHRIFKNSLDTKFDEGVFAGMSQEYLYSQLKFFSENYDVLSEQDLADCMKFKSFPRRSVLITFDDGYKDNFTLAYPLLLGLDISALFFAPTLALVNRRLGWWDLVAYVVKATSHRTMMVDNRVFDLGVSEEKRAAIKILQEKFYRLPDEETRDLVDELAAGLNVSLPEPQVQSEELMTRDDLREMVDNGMFVGAHTHSHKVLSTLSHAAQNMEIGLSKQLLEAELGSKIRSFAYPVGMADSFDEKTKEMVQGHGFSFAFSFYSGVNDPADIDPFDIKRTFRGLPQEGFLESFREPHTFIRPKR